MGVRPPFSGVAVKVTLSPVQIIDLEATMVTAGVTTGFTVMMISLLVTEAGEGQVASEVITTVTLSPWANELVV